MKKQILIVDDEEAIRLLLNEVLKDEYTIYTCENGLKAISWLSQGNKVDLIITDIVMPKMDGLSLVKNLRCSTKMRDIPIIVLSSCAGDEYELKALQNGVFDFVQKPFDPVKLEKIVKEALEPINIIK